MNQEFLFEMLKTPSVSGNETALQNKVKQYVEEFADEVITDKIGNIVAVLNPNCEKRILLCGHADEIGLAVTHITDEGMLKVMKRGGIYPSMYLGHKVRVQTQNGILYGSVAATRELADSKELKMKDILIDIGAFSKEEAEAYVELGDCIIFDTDYRELLSDCINGRALDDRIGSFIVMEACRRAKEKGCQIGVYSASTVGEETTQNGAFWVSQRVKPDCAIAVDVTYASDYLGIDKGETGDVKIGRGPVLCNAPIVSKEMNRELKESAKKLNMKIQIEAAGRTGTDADTIHFSNDGVETALVSIPLRYMHTPAEMGSLKDIEDCIELLAEYLCCQTSCSE